jgi:VWFA-related protein
MHRLGQSRQGLYCKTVSGVFTRAYTREAEKARRARALLVHIDKWCRFACKRDTRLKTIPCADRRTAGAFWYPTITMLGFCIAVLSPLTGAQQPPETTQTPGSVASNVTTVYVAVLEKSGKPVEGLTRIDFLVQERGVPSEVLEVSRATSSPLMIGTMVDLSGSANGEYRREFLQVLDSFFARSIHESETASLIAFAKSTYRVTGMTGSLGELRAGLKEVADGQPLGPTALYDCLFSASESLFQGIRGRPVLLVLGDFQDNGSSRKLDSTIAHLRDVGVAVFPLVPFEPRSQRSKNSKDGWRNAKRMAEGTGGFASSFETPAEMDTALSKIQALLNNSYLLRYRPSGSAERDRSVTVKVAGHAAEFVAWQLQPPVTE